MSDVLKRLDRKMKMQSRNVVLFLNNSTSHQEKLVELRKTCRT